ncbi:hypothetical protein, partial [Methylobacterium sp. E-066]|uniref:hypothetical protein n=1 Tax=Methylobacterium sp. E-066 TaxID=2836584 RepID=UPI001FBB99BE
MVGGRAVFTRSPSVSPVIAVEVHKFADRGTLPLEGFAMRDNSFDRTIERNYVQKWRFLIKEY